MAAHEFRVFADFSQQASETVGAIGLTSESDSHHLLRVLRLVAGDEIVVVSRATGNEYYCTIDQSGGSASVTITAQKHSVKSTPVVKSLLVALLKGSKNDLVCEQAAELGVREIIFWQSVRSVARSDADNLKKRTVRLSKIAESAARQSGQNQISQISLFSGLDQAIARARSISTPDDSFLCCCFAHEAKLIRDLPRTSHCHILVGPESDFDQTELKLALDAGFEPVSLGPLRLRSETAALAAVAIAQGLWGS